MWVSKKITIKLFIDSIQPPKDLLGCTLSWKTSVSAVVWRGRFSPYMVGMLEDAGILEYGERDYGGCYGHKFATASKAIFVTRF